MELTQNYFELFGLPVAFDIDAQQLAERYRELQRTLHPDRYANASDRERRLSVQHAAQVNEAFQTLKSSLRRARYLLQLKGVEFDDEKETHLDPAFLMEQIELREALADVRAAADPLVGLNSIMADIKTRQKAMEGQLQMLFADDSEDKRLEAKQLVQKMQFLVRLQQEAEELEEELVATM
ncbi:MAG: Fe-S protein assembly co-chaperone HscB [Gammaproteobacteria bacterium]|nr:Fe-S protein assembly co-chaperone HscB [Gammaproteobacteria bacterium]